MSLSSFSALLLALPFDYPRVLEPHAKIRAVFPRRPLLTPQKKVKHYYYNLHGTVFQSWSSFLPLRRVALKSLYTFERRVALEWKFISPATIPPFTVLDFKFRMDVLSYHLT